MKVITSWKHPITNSLDSAYFGGDLFPGISGCIKLRKHAHVKDIYYPYETSSKASDLENGPHDIAQQDLGVVFWCSIFRYMPHSICLYEL